jgi:hypothetical protein
MAAFHIVGSDGVRIVQGDLWTTTIGGRKAEFFIHTNCPLEGARLSCARSGMLVGKIAPHLLAYAVSVGDLHQTPSAKRDALGAALLIRHLVAVHGTEKLWSVMDAAPSIALTSESAAQ